MVGFIRRHHDFSQPDLKNYYKYVGFGAILAIVMHPTLLIWQLWRDGFGLPPISYEHYVAPAARWAVVVSSLAFFIFLAYELRRWYGKKQWWKYVIYAGDVALIGIFFHGLRLGNNLQHGWYRTVWYFYGVSLFIVLADKYLAKHRVAKA